MALQITSREGTPYDLEIEFRNEMDPASMDQCIKTCDAIPSLWWKDIMVTLRGIDRVDVQGLELLLYLRERASKCSLRVVDCHPDVERVLQVAGFSRYFDVSTEGDSAPAKRAMTRVAVGRP